LSKLSTTVWGSAHAFLQNEKPPLAWPLAARLFRDGLESACTETVHTVERETGLEPATACLEGRNSTGLLMEMSL